MSFTTRVKNEISNNYGNISENIAELAAIFRNSYQKADNILEIVTENSTVCKHIYRLIKEIYHDSQQSDKTLLHHKDIYITAYHITKYQLLS